MRILRVPKGGFFGMAFSPDGRYLATAHPGVTVRLWEPATGRELASAMWPENVAPHGVLFLPDGRSLIAGTFMGWRIFHVESAGFGADLTLSDRRLSGGADRHTYLHDAVLLPDGSAVICRTPRSPYLTFVALDGTASTWCQLGIERFEYLTAIALNRAGDLFAAASHRVLIWRRDQLFEAPLVGDPSPADLPDPEGPPLAELRHPTGIEDMRFSADGSRLVTAAGRTVRTWDTTSWECLAKVTASGRMTNTAALSPDGRLVIAAGNDREVKLYDADTGAERARYAFDIGKISRVEFAPDGLTAAAIAGTRKMVIWDVE